MNVKIEKGIKMPKARHKWPISEMKVGDSFTSDAPRTTIIGLYTEAKRQGMKISIRDLGDGRCRVWRIK